MVNLIHATEGGAGVTTPQQNVEVVMAAATMVVVVVVVVVVAVTVRVELNTKNTEEHIGFQERLVQTTSIVATVMNPVIRKKIGRWFNEVSPCEKAGLLAMSKV